MHENLPEPEEVISSIISSQGITDAEQIDCTKISRENFELLGESVMGKIAGDHELYEQMDQMMEGEGSASLEQI